MPLVPHRVYLETVGCQMNVLDSEMIMALLRQQGYERVETPERADTILFNTCSVRQHAEEKIYSALGKLRSHKRAHPEKVIGVLGCMAQKDQQRIFARAPFVDLIVSPGQLQQTAHLIDLARQVGGRQAALSRGRHEETRGDAPSGHQTFDPLRDPEMRPHPFQAYLRIQIGCDKFCSYCVVPQTRGPEQCRPPGELLEEARLLADQGCKELILLGQTVNSYRHTTGGRTTTLADLLYRLHELDGIRRLKFVTNYPSDMTDPLLQAVRDLPKCSRYLHVPLQSGSNRILERMRRGYRVEAYREMMQRIAEFLPDAAVSSDLIVGFCGETEADFQATAAMVRACRFKNCFIFKYSPRAGTAADNLPDDVPDPVKRERNHRLLALQTEISTRENRRFRGRTVEVLVEGPSKMAAKHDAGGEHLQLTGRTMCDRIVVFPGHRRRIGELLPVVIQDATPHTLIGRLPDEPRDHQLVSLADTPVSLADTPVSLADTPVSLAVIPTFPACRDGAPVPEPSRETR